MPVSVRLPSIADPLKAAIDNERKDAPQGSKANPNFLLEMIVNHVHTCVLQVATLSMMISAASRPGARINLRSCSHLLSDDIKVMLLALRYGEQIGVSAKAVERVNSLYRSFAAARAGLLPLAAAVAPVSSQRNLVQIQAAVWVRLAKEASATIQALQASVESRLNRLYAEDTETLRLYLNRAVAGETTEVDDFGVAHPPSLKQRRQNPRLSVQRDCQLVLPSGAFPGTLIDVSREGMQVASPHPLAMGQALIVETDDGQRLAAVVVRVKGSHFGLSMRPALSSSNPLMRSGASGRG